MNVELIYPFNEKYRDAHLARVEQSPEIFETLIAWTKKPKNILYLCGSVGTGKTYFSAAWYNHLIEKKFQYHVRVFREPDFYGTLNQCIDRGWSINEELKRLCQVPFFILDDMGCDKMTEHKYAVLESFIEARLNNNCATIITSNILASKLKENYNERICSRLLSYCNIIVDTSGPDRRQHIN
jgi:DNA replication protein DnaC